MVGTQLNYDKNKEKLANHNISLSIKAKVYDNILGMIVKLSWYHLL